MYFDYNEKEIEYLKNKCDKIADVIDKIGIIKRTIDSDLFSAVIHHIIGQQISMKAQETIWNRFKDYFKTLNAKSIVETNLENLQKLGISTRKAEYIYDFAKKVYFGELDLKSLEKKDDKEVIKELSSLKGIGVWTAEMLLLFCMNRKNVFSYDDLGIQRGLRMIYHHRKITKPLFEKYRKRFSPYCSIASLYIWAVSGGAIKEMKDYAPKKK